MSELAAAEASIVGNEICPFIRVQFGWTGGAIGVLVVVLIPTTALHVVDLSGNGIDGDSDIHVVNIHGGGLILIDTDRGAFGKKDGVNQCCLGDGLIQGIGLA